MLHIYIKKKITNQHYTCGSTSRTDKYDYKETSIRALWLQRTKCMPSTFKWLLFYKIDFDKDLYTDMIKKKNTNIIMKKNTNMKMKFKKKK